MVAKGASDLCIGIYNLLDPEKSYSFIRRKRWSNGVVCVKCASNRVKKNGHKDSDPNCCK